jgi:hypothetical protein
MLVDHVAGGIEHTNMHESGVQVNAGIESMLAVVKAHPGLLVKMGGA